VTGKGGVGEGVCGHKGGSKESSQGPHEGRTIQYPRRPCIALLHAYLVHPYAPKGKAKQNRITTSKLFLRFLALL